MTGTGFALARVFGRFTTVFRIERLTLRTSPAKSDHSGPRSSPSRRPTYAAVATTALYCKLVDRPVEVGEVLLSAGVGIIDGLLPDLLEPAIHPNHRPFFHRYA